VLLNGKQSLVVDGYYDLELSMDGTTSAVTCKYTKVASPNPNLSALGQSFLPVEILQANNDESVQYRCNAVYETLKVTPPGSCVADDSCFFSTDLESDTKNFVKQG